MADENIEPGIFINLFGFRSNKMSIRPTNMLVLLRMHVGMFGAKFFMEHSLRFSANSSAAM